MTEPGRFSIRLTFPPGPESGGADCPGAATLAGGGASAVSCVLFIWARAELAAPPALAPGTEPTLGLAGPGVIDGGAGCAAAEVCRSSTFRPDPVSIGRRLRGLSSCERTTW